MSTELEIRDKIKKLVDLKTLPKEWIACHMAISEKELEVWLKGRKFIKSTKIRNAEILLKEVDSQDQPFTKQEFENFWTFIIYLHDKKEKKEDILSQEVLLEIANSQTYDELVLYHNIYHYLLRQLAWNLYKSYNHINIGIGNKIMLSGRETYEKYLEEKCDKKQLLKMFRSEGIFMYLERVFLQYRFDKVPSYLFGTNTYPNEKINPTIQNKHDIIPIIESVLYDNPCDYYWPNK